MELSEYVVLFVFVVILGAGLPGLGDAALIAAGTLAGEGKLNVGLVLATGMVAWMLGSVIGFKVGMRGGRPLLDHPGRLERRRRNLLAKGDRAFGRHTFVASATLPAFVSGIFRVRFWLFMLGALVAGRGDPDRRPRARRPGRLVALARAPPRTTGTVGLSLRRPDDGGR